MATVAELKARLAKYAVPTQPSVGVQATVPPAHVAESKELVVDTELQPTTLVVVERPHGVADTGTSGGSATEADNGSSTNLDTTNPVHQDFLQRLADLEVALLHRDPLMKTHLGAIHKAMIQYEEIANLLTVEEIAKIMSAQQTHTNVILRVEATSKSKTAAGKKAAKLGMGDI